MNEFIANKLKNDLEWIKEQLNVDFTYKLSEITYSELKKKVSEQVYCKIYDLNSLEELNELNNENITLQLIDSYWLIFKCKYSNLNSIKNSNIFFFLQVYQQEPGWVYSLKWSIIGTSLRMLIMSYKTNWRTLIKHDMLHTAGSLVLSNSMPIDEFNPNIKIENNIMDDFNKYGLSNNPNIFSDLLILSHMTYEKSDVKVNLIFVSYENAYSKKNQFALWLNEPVSLKNYKLARKLFEISSWELYTVCTQSHILGFANRNEAIRFDNNYKLRRGVYNKTVLIELTRSRWDVRLFYISRLERLFYYKNSLFLYYEKEKIDYISELKNTFPGCNIQSLLTLVISAIGQTHGTMVIVSEEAAIEVGRLASCCIRIKPTELNDEIAKGVTAIDGAILCDPQGICYAIGVILDGEHIIGNGESIDRGARHNSAKRYAHWTCTKCLILIVSEDGEVMIVKSKNVH